MNTAILCSFLALGDPHGIQSFFEQTVNYIIENEEYSYLLIAGDLADDNNGREFFYDQRRRLRDNNFSVITTRGNHDDYEWFTYWLNAGFESPRLFDVCGEANVTIISIDSMRRSQHTFVEDAIRERPERRYVILMHYPPIACSIESSQNADATFWKRFLEDELRYTDLIIAGHAHVFCSYELINRTHVIVTSTAGSKRYTCSSNFSSETNSERFCEESRIGDRAVPSYVQISLTENGWSWENQYVDEDFSCRQEAGQNVICN